jgi:hypothetical protein
MTYSQSIIQFISYLLLCCLIHKHIIYPIKSV